MANCKEKAVEWGLSLRDVNDLCKRGKIEGAYKIGKKWFIPDNASRPFDKSEPHTHLFICE